MIKKIGSIAVVVKDEKKAANWYKSKLGFEIKSQMEHWVTVIPKGGSWPRVASLQNETS